MNETGLLIVSGSRKIAFLSPNRLSRPPGFVPITRRLRNVLAIDFDFKSKLIYFAEAGRRAGIKAVFLNGTGMRVVIDRMYYIFKTNRRQFSVVYTLLDHKVAS